jgi:hypothetical protein
MPHIVDLPFEILSEIFDNLTPHGRDLLRYKDYSDLFAVRGTCRTFRAISSTLRVWYDEDFCISHVVRYMLKSTQSPEVFDPVAHEACVCGLIGSLKNDEILLQTLTLQQCYSFRTVPTLILFSECIPSFRMNITSLVYETYRMMNDSRCNIQSINIGLAHLGLCPNLVSLHIGDEPHDISLSQVVTCFPSLKRLKLYSNGGYSGSLRGLRNLEKLVIYDYLLEENTPSRQYFLPIDSALSLKNLQLFARGTPSNVYNSKHLLKFTNLSKITLQPLCNRLCKTLTAANFTHLRKLAAIVHAQSNISIDKLLQFLKCQSLRSLQELRFLVEPLQWDLRSDYLNIICTITTHLSELEQIQLTTGINTAWCKQFSKLRKLEGIAWVCSEEECIDTNDLMACPLEDSDIATEEEYAEMTAVVMRKMKDVFRECEQQPDVYIKLLDEENFEQWDELFEEYEED